MSRSRAQSRSHQRRSASLSRDHETLYRSIPQALVASNPIPLSPTLGDEELYDNEETVGADVLPDSVTADPRIEWMYFVLGCAVLLPWNALITAVPYFVSSMQGSSLQNMFGSYLTSTFTVANFCFLAYATATSKGSSASRRITMSTLCLAFLMFLLTLSTFFHTSPGLFFTLVILNGIIQACAGSFMQTSIIAIAALFGPGTVRSVMAGQAAVAVLVSTVQVLSTAVSLWSDPAQSALSAARFSQEATSACIFFALSTVFLIFTSAMHTWLMTTPDYRAVVVSFEQNKSASIAAEPDERQGLVSNGPDLDIIGGRNRIFRLAKANMVYEIAVAFVFIVTLAVFPPITVSVLPVGSINPLLFSALHFLVFNVGDLAGRYVCSVPRFLVWDARSLLSLSFARVLFIPLFLMCNVQQSSSQQISSVINSDLVFMLLLLLFGLSNGYVSSMCMMSAGSVEHNPRLEGRREDVDTAATVASFCLVGGLALGSMGSFAVRFVMCGCNPFTAS